MINGFSKLTNLQKIELLSFLNEEEKQLLKNNYKGNLEKLTENVISSYSLPLSVVPNCVINNQNYFIPMVTEESSIVAACGNAFKFISRHGGFESRVLSKFKKGNIYFDYFKGIEQELDKIDIVNHPEIIEINQSMQKRNAGLISCSYKKHDDFLKITCVFNTDQAMGANFINTVLEKVAEVVSQKIRKTAIMSILSNNYDTCLTESKFKIPLDKLTHTNLSAEVFLDKFVKAMKIANLDVDRAVTHNKGFMNGVDAVLLATGQDLRAINAAAHSLAAKSGGYKSFSQYQIKSDYLEFFVQFPISVGVVGGITQAHEQVRINHKIIDPKLDVELLSKVIVSTGLAQNFSAISALISEGIQKGHMKMHLDNILIQLKATQEETVLIKNFFKDKKVSYNDVKNKLFEIKK